MSERGLPELAAPEPWMSEEESEKAWMSVRDADLLELLLLAHAARSASPVTVLEWGSGRSTLSFSGALERRGLLGSWISLEHNREFFLSEVAPRLPGGSASYALAESLSAAAPELAEPARAGADRGGDVAAERRVRAVVFDAGELRPYDPEHAEDRAADLEDYIALPARLGRRFDLVLVDGRKRRRCLLEASELLGESGLVVLHDAWREYYHCAFEAFAFARRIGDMLWVGAQRDPELEAILPAHAFRGHADSD